MSPALDRRLPVGAEVAPGSAFPDPASRFQPQGPHGPSQVVDPSRFPWTDAEWQGLVREGQVIYEMHLGTFTPEGTWAAAARELPELAELGITVIELMPVAEFPGEFGWGYDGVNLFASHHLYGSPDDCRRFVDRAHAVGIGVILDVVYNHLGPDGNYLKQFSENYFTDRYRNDWGEALNFEDCEPSREFFIANAGYWVDEYHFDGLRLDATQDVKDASPEHVLIAMGRRAREAGGGRSVYLVSENEPQDTQLIRPLEEGGYGLDALWNDDFHHSALVALTYALHRDLLRLRREDPVLRSAGWLDGAVLGPEAFVLRFFGETARDRLLLINLGTDLPLEPVPEPLLAPPAGIRWELLWSSEDPKYGGIGTTAPEDEEGRWRLPGRAAVVVGVMPLTPPTPSLPAFHPPVGERGGSKTTAFPSSFSDKPLPLLPGGRVEGGEKRAGVMRVPDAPAKEMP